jgi:dihydrofolate reductase
MTTSTYYTAMTLDGFLADENDSLDWLFRQDQDEDGPMNYKEFITGVGAIVMGATTYQWLLDHDDNWPYDVPAWVVTHRRFPSTDHDIRFVEGDVDALWADIAASAGDREVWIVGGGDLAAQFAEAGHLDRMIVYIAPVTLGAGRPVFPRRFDFELANTARNGAFVCAEYVKPSRM